MSDLEAAPPLLAAAARDLHALRNMLDPGAFPLEVFGFHAQQVVEKSLKAWLSLRGQEYPWAHNLRLLITRLEPIEPELAEVWNLVELGPLPCNSAMRPSIWPEKRWIARISCGRWNGSMNGWKN